MRFFVQLTIFLIATSATGQQKLSDRIYVGGGFGLSGGSNSLNLSLSPQVGYKITPRFSAGVGITYQYAKIRQISTSISNYGWSLFSRYNITRQLFAYSEFERLRFQFFTSLSPEQTERSSYNSLLIGGGYAESISSKASYSISVLYNVLYDAADNPQPYNSPLVVRAGIGLGVF